MIPNPKLQHTEIMLQTRESKSTFRNNPSKRTYTIFDNSKGTDNHSSASFLFENQTRMMMNSDVDNQYNEVNNTTIRSSSLNVRAKKEGIGYKNG